MLTKIFSFIKKYKKVFIVILFLIYSAILFSIGRYTRITKGTTVDVSSITATVQRLNERNEELERELSLAKSKRDEIEKGLGDCLGTISEIASINSKLEGQMESYGTDIEGIIDQITELGNTIDRIIVRNAELERKFRQLRESIEE